MESLLDKWSQFTPFSPNSFSASSEFMASPHPWMAPLPPLPPPTPFRFPSESAAYSTRPLFAHHHHQQTIGSSGLYHDSSAAYYDSAWSSPFSEASGSPFGGSGGWLSDDPLPPPAPQWPPMCRHRPLISLAPLSLDRSDAPSAANRGVAAAAAQRVKKSFPKKPDYYPNFNPRDFHLETVAVENASVVAQIVGKKGARIEALIKKFGTTIQTPKADEEPVFIIKGKRADVYRTRDEIMSAGQHFKRIDAEKRAKFDAACNSGGEHTTQKLFVPLRFIGLVIGKRGRVVHTLQVAHKVFIETPVFGVRPWFLLRGEETAIINAVNAIFHLLASKTGLNLSYRQWQVGEEVAEVHLEE